MNKNLYRVVFNQARGMLMVVPEIARATGTAASGTGHTLSRLIGKVSALSFSLWLALGAIQPAQADIVANGAAAKNQQPTIVAAANGTPQVNIQTPSGAGVSRNSFSRFDVDQKGVILNNATRMTQSELAGMVAANPWLARGEAKVILNEVSSRDPSRLNGIIEVAGQRAQVVIASPAGITCDGCGFINASRTTLTTGQVQMTGGQISGYDVQRGEIVIDGRGMDSTRADSTDLIARAVKVNTGIWAKDLKVSAGRNVVDAAHQTVTATGGDDSPRPQFAVDVAQLGGMYARKIHLRGTERGVGVRNAGVIGASAGDVVVALVCALFLWHLRSALVAIISLPLGLCFAFIIMHFQGLNANIMSLGGIAIAVGAMVDAAIVMIENAHKRLEEWQQQHPGQKMANDIRWQVITNASVEVGPALFIPADPAQSARSEYGG
jgi:filamentous hemagglutinin